LKPSRAFDASSKTPSDSTSTAAQAFRSELSAHLLQEARSGARPRGVEVLEQGGPQRTR
jgi:hypothetical protein